VLVGMLSSLLGMSLQAAASAVQSATQSQQASATANGTCASPSLLPQASSEPTLLTCTFDENKEVKALGARWCPEQKRWYAPPGIALAPLAKWIDAESVASAAETGTELKCDTSAAMPNANSSALAGKDAQQAAEISLPKASAEPVYLTSTFTDKEEIKGLGAYWDRDESSWYVPANTALKPFAKWISAEAASRASNTPAKPKAKASPKPLGKPKKLPAKTLKQLEKEAKNLQSFSSGKLKEMLKLNDQKTGGTKAEQIARVAEGMVLGAIPRCPSCAGGRPNFDLKAGLYTCPGHMDDDVFVHCDWSSYSLQRVPWQH